MSSDTEASADLGPAEPEMELALLALAMADNAVMDRLGPLEADDFADPMHGVAFAAMQELRSEGRAISLVNMQAKANSMVFVDGTGLLDALKAHSFQGAPPDAHELAEQIRDRSLRRQIMQQGGHTMDAVWNHADTPGAIIAARRTAQQMPPARQDAVERKGGNGRSG
jgi:replicative DNA helicase